MQTAIQYKLKDGETDIQIYRENDKHTAIQIYKRKYRIQYKDTQGRSDSHTDIPREGQRYNHTEGRTDKLTDSHI